MQLPSLGSEAGFWIFNEGSASLGQVRIDSTTILVPYVTFVVLREALQQTL